METRKAIYEKEMINFVGVSSLTLILATAVGIVFLNRYGADYAEISKIVCGITDYSEIAQMSLDRDLTITSLNNPLAQHICKEGVQTIGGLIRIIGDYLSFFYNRFTPSYSPGDFEVALGLATQVQGIPAHLSQHL